MNHPVQHPITLRFQSRRLEAAFHHDYVERSLRQVRLALLLGASLYLAYSVVDWMDVPYFAATALAIRGTVFVLGLMALGLTFTDLFRRWMQPMLSGFLLIAGSGLLALLALEPSGNYYYYGPTLIIFGLYMMFRLRFIYATAVGWLIVVGFVIVVVFIKEASVGRVVSNAAYLGVANVIGMFGAYMLERYARQTFWQTQVIDQKRKENEKLLHTRSRFFDNVSHEFRTPLTLILGPLDTLLARPDLPADAEASIQRMQRNAQRLLRLINQLLDLAKLEAGGLRLRAAQTDAITYLRGLVQTFSDLAARKRISLTFQSEAESVPLYFDRDKLEQVVTNLLSNALKFTPEGGSVRVAIAVENDQFVLRVRDTGPGIPADEQTHIFDRFHQADASTVRGAEGTGIGLALTRELVALHHGTIEVQSEPGFGSAFAVTLPLGRAHLRDEEITEAVPELEPTPPLLPEADAPVADDAAVPEEAETILIVEDNADVRAYVRECLGPDYHVVEAADGQGGLTQARALVPDLVISDVMMPGMDGYEFAAALKADRVLDHIPIILLTAKSSEESKLAGLATGVDVYLTKPFSARELCAHVHNLLENRRRLQQRFRQPLNVQASPVEVTSTDDQFVQQAREAVEANIADEHFNVDAFADAMAMSRRQLQRKLRAVTGETPVSFVRMIRLSRAAQLIAQQYGTVSEIAYAVGFSNPSYFARCFRDTFGVAPSEYDGTPAP